ncbi:Rieske 2Fe-2S domain-containing protein [Parasphingorhabdus sp. JC815]|uniref:Rieske 2Fe-2S domain-containing protein n=1 Tax=Parasphingorhabdus sp. JC815 TaxID=3232140 RepID=UPI003457AA3C
MNASASHGEAAVMDARTAPVAASQVLEKMTKEEIEAWRVADLPGRLSPEERNLNIGFPVGWYPLMLSEELAIGEVKPLRYFAQDLAIWRGEDGEVRMIEAYCKHLGAHMGYGGKVHGNLLECPFHAWRYDGEEGVVKDIPYAKAIPPQVKRKCKDTWPMHEANQLIWTWYHPDGVEPQYEVVDLPEATDPEWSDFDECRWTIYGSIQNMAENGVDFPHFTYIHGVASPPVSELEWGEWDRKGIVRAKMGTPRGEVDGKITSISQGPGQNWVRFEGICETLLIACITPVELDQLAVRYFYTQPISQIEGPMAGLARAIIKDVNKQLDQDKVVWDRMKFEVTPLICDGDGPIPKFRKFYSRYYADKQVAENIASLGKKSTRA